MSIRDAARVAVAQWEGRTVAGMDLPTVMVAIAGAESGWRNNAAGDKLGNTMNCAGWESWGLWQIHMPSHAAMLRQFSGAYTPCDWSEWLSDPHNNARAADAVIGSPAPHLPLSALHPWTVWWSRDGGQTNAGDGNGRYRDYLAQAAEAVAAERGTGAPPPDEPGDSPGGPVPLPVAPVTVSMMGAGVLGLAAVAGLLVGLGFLIGEGDHR